MKVKCVQCGQEVRAGEYKSMLMVGPRGYRRYPICRRCLEQRARDAAKNEKK